MQQCRNASMTQRAAKRQAERQWLFPLRSGWDHVYQEVGQPVVQQSGSAQYELIAWQQELQQDQAKILAVPVQVCHAMRRDYIHDGSPYAMPSKITY
jgi:glutathione S-transferase